MSTQSARTVPMTVLLITFLSALAANAQPPVAREPRVPSVQLVDEALALGDREVAEMCRRVASRLAETRKDARAR